MIPAFRRIKKGRLGLNDDLTVASFPAGQFFLTKFISIFGKTFYLTVLASMLSVFSCTYSNNNWHLLRDSSLVCFSSQHTIYFVLAIFILLFYYPLATLLYPNIAFQDKALDLKFDTTYLVIESQGKVVIAGFYAFFAKEEYIWLQLIVSISVSIILFALCLKMKPCLIKSYNLWKAGGFIIPIWICTCGLINYYSEDTILPIVLLVTGLGIALGAIIGINGKIYGFSFIRKLKHLKTVIQGIEIIEDDKPSDQLHDYSFKNDELPVVHA